MYKIVRKLLMVVLAAALTTPYTLCWADETNDQSGKATSSAATDNQSNETEPVPEKNADSSVISEKSSNEATSEDDGEVLSGIEGDTPFSPFTEENRLDISGSEFLSEYLKSIGGSANARSISADHFYSVLNYALRFEGLPYVWGGKSPSAGGFDCSGLVIYVYNQVLGAGINGNLTNAASLYYNYCNSVSYANAKPGDLVFWRGTYGSDVNYISHVGIYCGSDVVYCAGDPIGFYSIRSSENINGKTAEFLFGRMRCVDDGNVATAPTMSDQYELVFNYNFFKAANSGIASAYGNDSAAALSGFLTKGMDQGWWASPVFDVQYYKNTYPDLQKAYGNNLSAYYTHFIKYGAAEGRRGSALFDVSYYRSHNADLEKVYGSNLKSYYLHFVRYGMNEGRQCVDDFIPQCYKNHYPDLQTAYGNDWVKYYAHYYKYGMSEGRTGTSDQIVGTTQLNGVNYSAVYSYDYYSEAQPDVIAWSKGDPVKTLQHFINYGMSEGRQAKDSFDVASYYNANQDLRKAYGTSFKSYYTHYIKYGQKEGRTTTGVSEIKSYITSYGGTNYSVLYDGSYYRSKYSDLNKAFSKKIGSVTVFDDAALIKHFVNYGMSEGRQASENFDANYYRSQYVDLRAAYGSNLKSYYLHYLRYGFAEDRVAVPGK